MYKLLICLAFSTGFNSPLEVISDFFDVYSKRNREIDAFFVESLSTEDNKWKQYDLPFQGGGVRSFFFIPIEKSRPNEDEFMQYVEWDLRKKEDKTLKDIHSIYDRCVREPLKDGAQVKILLETDNIMVFETILREELKKPITIWTAGNTSIIEKFNDDTFATHQYSITGRLLSPEEKDYWLKFFDYAKITPPSK